MLFVFSFKRHQKRFAALPSAVWQSWATVVVGFPARYSSATDQAQPQLVRFAYQHAPEQVIAALFLLIEREDATENPDIEAILRRVCNCWDDRLASALIEIAHNAERKPATRGQVIRALLAQGNHETRLLAESLLALPLPTGEPERRLVVLVAAALMEESEDCGWSAVWPVLEADADVAEQVISRVLWHDHLTDTIFGRLSAASLSLLYVWLAGRYPHAEDVQPPWYARSRVSGAGRAMERRHPESSGVARNARIRRGSRAYCLRHCRTSTG